MMFHIGTYILILAIGSIFMIVLMMYIRDKMYTNKCALRIDHVGRVTVYKWRDNMWMEMDDNDPFFNVGLVTRLKVDHEGFMLLPGTIVTDEVWEMKLAESKYWWKLCDNKSKFKPLYDLMYTI